MKAILITGMLIALVLISGCMSARDCVDICLMQDMVVHSYKDNKCTCIELDEEEPIETDNFTEVPIAEINWDEVEIPEMIIYEVNDSKPYIEIHIDCNYTLNVNLSNKNVSVSFDDNEIILDAMKECEKEIVTEPIINISDCNVYNALGELTGNTCDDCPAYIVTDRCGCEDEPENPCGSGIICDGGCGTVVWQ